MVKDFADKGQLAERREGNDPSPGSEKRASSARTDKYSEPEIPLF